MKVYNSLLFIKEKMTPVKLFAVLLIIFGIFDHLTNPMNIGTEPSNLLVETLVRGLFIFSGLFCLLGNGRTTKIRAYFTGVPYIYLSIFYLIHYLNNDIAVIILPMILTGFIGLWLVIAGEYYESNKSRTSSSNSRFFDWLSAEFNNEIHGDTASQRGLK